MPGRTPEGDALTDLVLPVFELNGEFLAAAAMITAPHELTPARWQVLGAVLDAPLPVPEIARRIGLGLTRQSVQRVANDVVAQGWAVWQPTPPGAGSSLLTLPSGGATPLMPCRTSSTPGRTPSAGPSASRTWRSCEALSAR